MEQNPLEKKKSFLKRELAPLERFSIVAIPLYLGFIAAVMVVFGRYENGFKGTVESLADVRLHDYLLKQIDLKVSYITYGLGFVLAVAGASFSKVQEILQDSRRTILHNVAVLGVVIGVGVALMSWLLVHDGVSVMLRLQKYSGSFLEQRYTYMLLADMITAGSALFVLTVPVED